LLLLLRNSTSLLLPALGCADGVFQIRADLLQHLGDSRERFGRHLRVRKRACDVHLHNLLIRFAHQILYKRQLVLMPADDRREYERKLLIERRFALAVQVHDIAEEIDLVEIDISPAGEGDVAL
jgi:hypothetical protein